METDYGDIVLRNKTHLDTLLSRLGQEKGLPKYYKGKITGAILCKNKYTNMDELHDLADLQNVNESDLVKGTELVVINNHWTKSTLFQGFIKGSHYKWETVNGFYMILSQNDVDKLSDKEKRYLRL